MVSSRADMSEMRNCLGMKKKKVDSPNTTRKEIGLSYWGVRVRVVLQTVGFISVTTYKIKTQQQDGPLSPERSVLYKNPGPLDFKREETVGSLSPLTNRYRSYPH